MTLVPASDGLPARLVQSWNSEKLFYVDRYFDIFTTGMRRKWSLVYADLLAGPGICVEVDTGTESPGSPLLAVQHKEFGRLLLNDIDPTAANALRSRIASEPTGRIVVESRDCNDAVDRVRDVLFQSSSAFRTLGLAVIDPTAFQIRYDSIVRLTTGIRLDLIIIFMTGFVRRFIRTPEFQ